MSAAKRLLLVDDDAALRGSLAEQLELHEEFVTVQAADGGQALEKVKAEHFDLILLDVGLPDIDGRELCKLIRKTGVRCPVIMLTAAASDADAILGLDSGANDYVVKPFKLLVLLARIRAQLRQHEQSEDAVFAIGPYTFKPAAKLLLDNEKRKKVRLTEKETSILKYLFRAGDRAVSRDVLLNEVWGYNAGVTTHTLETHIYRLRQKIERDPSKAAILVTDPGGYRLAP
ncbi:response regulator transcription factor [Desertibaculum subflavum]|uniref:response regulator transcription factor n=1 Tax=Desertibaculum subflavum TaxID=2268458 RepID=UPI000E6756A4